MYIKQYLKTAQTALRGQTNGGIFYMFPQMIMKIIYLLPLLFIWRVLAESGPAVEMTLPQLLSYTYINALLADMLIVRTHLTEWNADGEGAAMFPRPMPIFGQVISRTVGEWLPTLLFFSLPMTLVAPLFGISLMPKSLWALPSLVLCASLGFAMEFIFYCITLRLRNVAWLTQVIRSAIVSFFSGVVIPFRILPFGMDRWMSYQPFGSLGGATLSLFVGTAQPLHIVTAQIVWNVIFWALAAYWFNKSKERMMSFGG